MLSDPQAGGGNRFDDTHHICFKCNQQAIHDEKVGRKKLNEVRNLLEKAGIMKEAKVVGAVDRVSIWAPERYINWIEQGEEGSGVTGIYI